VGTAVHSLCSLLQHGVFSCALAYFTVLAAGAFGLLLYSVIIAVLPEHADSKKLAFITGLLLVISFLWTVYKNGGVVNFSGWRTFRLTLPFFVSTTSAAFFTYLFLYAYNQHVFWAELFSLVSLLLTQSRGVVRVAFS